MVRQPYKKDPNTDPTLVRELPSSRWIVEPINRAEEHFGVVSLLAVAFRRRRTGKDRIRALEFRVYSDQHAEKDHKV